MTKDKKMCQFAFRYNGVLYPKCTKAGGESKYWCATKTNEKDEYITGHYGYCEDTCPKVAGICIQILLCMWGNEYANRTLLILFCTVLAAHYILTCCFTPHRISVHSTETNTKPESRPGETNCPPKSSTFYIEEQVTKSTYGKAYKDGKVCVVVVFHVRYNLHENWCNLNSQVYSGCNSIIYFSRTNHSKLAGSKMWCTLQS